RTAEDERVPTKVQGIPGEAVRSCDDEMLLRMQHDHGHATHIKVECGPCTQYEARGNKCPTKPVRNGTLEISNPQEVINAGAEQRHCESDRDDKDIMERALKKRLQHA